jgi:capping protein beta
MSDDQLNSALNLMRRMPPASIENSLAGLIELVPELTEELLNHVDQPLKVRRDPLKNADFILCDYNRDGDSFRSPWSNLYYPPMDDGILPDPRLRALETEANAIFDIYRRQYFEGGFSSVYFFDTEEKSPTSFGSCFLIHKDIAQEKGLDRGWWDSIHVFEAAQEKKGSYVYKLITTVIVSLQLSNVAGSSSSVDLSGSMTKQDERRLPVDERTGGMGGGGEGSHIANLGTMLEEMELRVRNAIEGIYIQKTREVVNGMRSTSGAREKAWEQLTNSLNQAVQKRHE